MKLTQIINPEQLEKELENRVKQAFKNEDYLRCNNLVNYLLKVNCNNSVGKYYRLKLTPTLLKKAKYKWLGFKGFASFLFDIKTYIILLLIFLRGR